MNARKLANSELSCVHALGSGGFRRIRGAARRSVGLAGLFMGGVRSLPTAVLLHLDALAIVDLVLSGHVISPFADLTSQGHDDALFVLCHMRILLRRRRRRLGVTTVLHCIRWKSSAFTDPVAAGGLEPPTSRL